MYQGGVLLKIAHRLYIGSAHISGKVPHTSVNEETLRKQNVYKDSYTLMGYINSGGE